MVALAIPVTVKGKVVASTTSKSVSSLIALKVSLTMFGQMDTCV
jgi:putative effector of murein hydrolase